MKTAVMYNRNSQNVINLFGIPYVGSNPLAQSLYSREGPGCVFWSVSAAAGGSSTALSSLRTRENNNL